MLERYEIDPKIKIRKPSDLMVLPRSIKVDTFSEESVKTFSDDFNAACQTNQSVVPIVIDTFGGDPYSLLAMIDLINQASVPVATIIEGKAMSCGVILFSCGTEGYRYISPNSTLMIHDVSCDEVTLKSEEVMANAKETNRLNRKLYSVMERNCGKPRNYFWDHAQKRGRADWYMTARDAVKHNVANHIGIPMMRTTISVTTTFG